MTIKKDQPKRRKSFRARHKCDTNPPDKLTPRYWSVRNGRYNPTMEIITILLLVGLVGYLIYDKHQDYIKDKIDRWL